MRLGDLLPNHSDEVACLNRANSSAQVMAIDGLISDLNKNWRPTGYYRPADIEGMLATLAAEAQNVGAAIAAAPLSTNDAQAVKDQAFEDIMRRYKDRSQGFERALATAKQTGATAINAPGFKDFVIASMRAISDGYVTATVLQCRQSWLEGALDRSYKAMAAIGAVAYRIVGVVVQAGENIVDATETLARVVAFLAKFAPYAAVGLAGLWGYTTVRKHGIRGLIPRRFRPFGHETPKALPPGIRGYFAGYRRR